MQIILLLICLVSIYVLSMLLACIVSRSLKPLIKSGIIECKTFNCGSEYIAEAEKRLVAKLKPEVIIYDDNK